MGAAPAALPAAGPLPARRGRADRAGLRRPARSPHASGFLAVYVAGVVLGNARLPHRQAILGFADGLAWLAQIGLFVLLGLLASPRRLAGAVLPALVVGRGAGAAGPAAVGRWSSVTPVPGRLARAGVPVLGRAARRGADRARHDPALAAACRAPSRLFDVVFVLVVIFTLRAGAARSRRSRGGCG